MIAPLLVAAALTAPAGFTEQPGLARRAASVAGKPVTVYCAKTVADWQAASTANAKVGVDALGYVDTVGGTTIYLSPQVCRFLINETKGRKVNLLDFGAALQTLAHESEHLAGVANEGETECAALAALPKFARTQFGIRKTATLGLVVGGARQRHAAAVKYSDVYRGPCDG